MLELTSVFNPFPMLKTKRCLLRDIQTQDAHDLFLLMSDPRVMLFWGREPLTQEEQGTERVAFYQHLFANHEAIPWAIVHQETRQVIGTCVFWNLNPANYRAEIGYALGSSWWGQGLATEVVSTMIAFGFDQMGLHSIEAQTTPDNLASKRVLVKLGFMREAYFRENTYNPKTQRFHDTTVFSLLKRDWENRTS